MKQVLFPEVVWFQEGPGVRNTQYRDSGVKLLNVANLVDGRVDLSNTDRYISEEEAYGKYKHFLVDDGDFIIASSGIKVEYFDKKMGFVSGAQLPLCMNTSTIRFKVLDKNILDVRYFMYFLKTDQFKQQLSREITGSAQLNFGPSHLKKMHLPLIDLTEQRKIAAVLDKVSDLIAKRHQQLTKLDELVKARFVEMFGDRVANEKHWDRKALQECATFFNGKAHEQVIDEKGQYILVTSKFIASNQKEYRKTNEILFPLHRGDICMVMSDVPNGRALAKCVLIDQDNKYTLNQRICCFRGYEMNAIFLLYMLNRHEYFLSFDDGDSQTNLRKKDILACPIIFPPFKLQNQFAAFVEQTDKTKTTIKHSLDKLETLKKALMQKYFGE